MANLHRLIAALFCWAFCSVAVASIPPVTQQAPEGYCQSKAGNTFAGGCTASPMYGSLQAAGDAVVAAQWVGLSPPRILDGGVTCGVYSGSAAINCSQPGHWMNGASQVNETKGGAIIPICAGSNGSRPTPGGAVESKACVTAAQCPSGSTLQGGVCNCNASYTELNGQCVSPAVAECAALAGKSAGNSSWWNGATGGIGANGFTRNQPLSSTHSYCDSWNPVGGGKCVATTRSDISSVGQVNGVDTWKTSGQSVYTGTLGSSCDGGGGDAASPGPGTSSGDTSSGGGTGGGSPTPPKDPAPGASAPAPCPLGQAAGDVNGTRICAPLGPDVPKQTNDGSSSGTVTNPDGSSTTTTKNAATQCTGANCTTTADCTQSTKSTTGTVTTAACAGSSSTVPKDDFCSKNPASKQCGETTESSFGGTCAGGFQAKGDDAVLNAMAQEQFIRNCQVFATDKAESVVVAAAIDATGLQKASTAGDSTVAVSSSNFDTSNSLGGGGCSLNKTITVAHMTATLPFNVICDPLAYLGQVLVAVSLLLAARIVARG